MASSNLCIISFNVSGNNSIFPIAFTRILLSNWLSGSLKKISDVLRLIVLVAIYPTIAQFSYILINDESSFTLIPPLLIGLAITLISATLLFRRYRKHTGGEILSE